MYFILRRMQSSVPNCITQQANKIRISVQAKPNSRANAISEISQEYIAVNIAAPPKEGEANKELCSFLAQVLSVRKSQVSVKPGTQKSRCKVLELEVQLSPSEVYQALVNYSN